MIKTIMWEMENRGRCVDSITGLLLHTIDEPVKQKNMGDNLYWFWEGKNHRDNGPAVEFAEGPSFEAWWNHGKLHRFDGPAIIGRLNYGRWFINGRQITDDVEDWLFENPAIPHWKKWTDADKVLFKLRFSQ